MKTLLFSLFSLFIILAGCSNEANQPSKQNEAEQKESAKDHQHQESAEEHHHEEQAREHMMNMLRKITIIAVLPSALVFQLSSLLMKMLIYLPIFKAKISL
ncbi:hypothetical protein [Bacillus canaveralius]|uniref:hypothetical protein n=1 Tax=Bacillus canaveralius TaxID=1403243 RepID=UPI000F779E3E|nr:hypothetical protein [Bacillus canaveralius]RSK57075.1 hypothetical protein EJA13_01480 [Bacillus canaveralius]